MKILSAKLKLNENIYKDRFYEILIKWLKDSLPSKTVGERFECAENKDSVKIQDEYCSIETFTIDDDGNNYVLFNFSHVFYEQTWVTEIILKTNGADKSVYIHVRCSGDINSFEKVPLVRSEIIRAFIKSGYVARDKLPVQAEPIDATDELKDVIVDAVNGKYEGKLPMIFVTKIFDSAGYEIDTDNLAKRLAGLAYIVAEREDGYAASLKERTDGKNPYNGHIAIYYPNGRKSRSFKPRTWGVADNQILNEIVPYVTAQVDLNAPTWTGLQAKKMADDVKIKNELLDEFDNENDTLEERLKTAQKRIAALTAKVESLQAALTVTQQGAQILRKAEIDEYFSGEQYDLVITVLMNALQNYAKDSRTYELVKGIVDANPLKGEGKTIFDKVKAIFSSGEGIKDKEFAELRDMGFEIISDNKHYKLVFKGDERRWFTIAKTPSDNRSGKNLASDIIKRLSIYK